MNRRNFLKNAATMATASILTPAFAGIPGKHPRNFVIIFLDDSGWADFEPFGDHRYSTPNVERLASEGCRFNNFHVPQAICSASRAALLSGCYPGRTKVFGAHGPNAKGLDPKWATLGEVLQAKDYTTAAFGKWHIGDQPATRPPARGFDESCGLMYSNDMWKHHPRNPKRWGRYPLRYWENGEVTIEEVTPEDQKMLTTWYTEQAVNFIDRHADKPFFLYLAHSMPHVPLYCSEKFKDKSGAGLYGDVMMEIDWSIGRVLKTLKQNGLEDDTLVIFTSDNGPWISYGNHAGETPFREAKATSFEGGIRSACTMRYPPAIEPGSSSDKMLCSVDILPTISYLANAKLPDNPIDGRNVWDLIADKPGASNPHEYYAFSSRRSLQGVMTGDGKWKLHLPHKYRTLLKAGKDGDPGKYEKKKIGLALFDMEKDPYETTNVIERHPEIAARLKRFADKHKARFYK